VTAGRTYVSATKDWCTPPALVAAVRQVFGGSIALDPCSNEFSTVGADKEYLLPDHDGLVESWDHPSIYVNPPYGKDLARRTKMADWFARMATAAAAGSEVIALVPVATNTAHWKAFVYPAAAGICFLYEPRVRFFLNGAPDRKGAPMSCCVLYYGARFDDFAAAFSRHGAVVPLAGVVLPA
jgi:hypothetical protein